MMLDIPAAASLITALTASVAALITAVGSLQVVLYRLKQLELKMDKHNSVIERMVIVEADTRRHDADIDELYDRLHAIETHKIGGSD